jgi:fructokinase
MSHHKPFTIAAFGEVLWDLLPDRVIIGGAPFNFTYRINSLGNRAYIISSVGKDDYGEKALEKIRELNMSTKYIQQDNRYPTGTVEVFLDEQKKPDYNIITGVAYDHIPLNDSIISMVRSADCFCFGTLARRNRESRETLQALLDSFKGRFRLYDINLRKNCYTRDAIHESLIKTDILKLNDEEAGEVNGLLQLNAANLPGIAKEILDRYPVQICIITLGSNGVLAFSAENEIVYEPGYRVLMEDPLGAGDAFSAGFISKILSGSDLRGACRFGNQLGAIVATQAGATQTITKNEMEVINAKTRYNIQPALNKLISRPTIQNINQKKRNHE